MMEGVNSSRIYLIRTPVSATVYPQHNNKKEKERKKDHWENGHVLSF
jgi:hypothetical protein